MQSLIHNSAGQEDLAEAGPDREHGCSAQHDQACGSCKTSSETHLGDEQALTESLTDVANTNDEGNKVKHNSDDIDVRLQQSRCMGRGRWRAPPQLPHHWMSSRYQVHNVPEVV